MTNYDIFISHASEDKSTVVDPLVKELLSLGVKVWYDEFELHIGKSLSRTIDHGLFNSKFGVVVLSESFFKKDWTEHELKGLLAKELGKDTVILPIWHKVDRNKVLKFSPYLADKLALDTNRYTICEIAKRIYNVVKSENIVKIGNVPNESSSIIKNKNFFYCLNCGALPGGENTCNLLSNHTFVKKSKRYVFCQNCGIIPKTRTTCNLLSNHSFIETEEDCFCKNCGVLPGGKPTCNLLSNHSFFII